MEKYIYNYLTENYYIKSSDVGNHGIYLINDARRFHTPINGSKLVTEIVTVFGITEDEAKVLINQWGVNTYKELDLDFYWKTNSDLFFGNIGNLVNNIGSSLSQDLVPVQAMSAPSQTLFYFDYVYESKTQMIKNKVKVIFKNIYNRIFGIFKN